MKRARKFIALLTAVTVMLAAVLTVSAAEDYGELKVSYKPFEAFDMVVDSEYPQIDGMSSLNSKIEDAVNDYYAANLAEFQDLSNGIVIKTEITDDHGVYSKLTVTLSLFLDLYGTSEKTLTFYINKSDYSEISESEYEEGINAVEEEEEEAPAEEEAAEEETIPEEELAELLVTMVPLRANLEALGFELEWNQELAAVEVYANGEPVVVLFIGEDIYVVGDAVVELGIAPVLENDVTYVPLSFFTEIIGAKLSKNENGDIMLSIETDEEEPAAEEEAAGEDEAAGEEPAAEDEAAGEEPAAEDEAAEEEPAAE